jgi:long-chain acyl-CoA synthetase
LRQPGVSILIRLDFQQDQKRIEEKNSDSSSCGAARTCCFAVFALLGEGSEIYMTDTVRPWLRNYPKEVPHEIDPDRYASLPDFQEKMCREYADLPAFSNFGSTVSYKKFDEMTTQLASYLLSLPGVQKGDRVALMMPNLMQYPVSLFGVLKAGLVVVNINPLYTSRELLGTLKDSGAKVLIIIENFAKTYDKVQKEAKVEHVITTQIGDLLGGLKGPVLNFLIKKVKKMVPEFHIPGAVNFSDALKKGASLPFNPPKIDRGDIALLQYTGGTTGVSKGAMLTHRNVLANVEQTGIWVSRDFKKGTEVAMVALPLYHIFSLTSMCFCMMWGSHCVLITNPRDMKGLVKSWSKYHYSLVCGVNTLFNGLLHTAGFRDLDFSHLKLTVGGGTQVQKAVAEEWKKATGSSITEAYGLTECSPGVAANPLGTPWNGSVGFPFSSTEISIRGPGFEDLGCWVTPGEIEEKTGEICVRGPQVMKGYWMRPDETEATIRDGWLRTGDVGNMDSNGRVTITDRQKDMILVSGFNVYPNEVEGVLQSMPEILECGVVGVPSAKSGETVKAVIVRKDPNLTKEQVVKYCRQQLTGYKMPREIIFVDSIPKTPVGKILRRELKDIVETKS